MNQSLQCIICSHKTPLDQIQFYHVRSNVRQFREEKFRVWHCRNCQSIHSQDKVNLETYYAHYPLEKQPLDYFRRKICQNRLNLLIKQGLNKDDFILDYGCNQGLFIRFLHLKGYRNAMGYDPYSLEYSDPRVLQKKYHYITCQDVLEHTENPQQCFSQLVSCLKKHGIIILGTPNAEEINLKQINPFLLHLHQPYHRHILSEKTILKLGETFHLTVTHLSKRWVNDTLYPFVNTRLSWAYALTLGNDIDVFFEPIKIQVFFTSPQLWFYAFFGYFFPLLGNLIIVFKK